MPLYRFIMPQERARTVALPEQGTPAPPQLSEIPYTVRYTGEPTEIIIRHAGEELARFTPDSTGLRQGKIMLPTPTVGSYTELEVQATWQASPGFTPVITLELSPPHLPTASATRWGDPGEASLHDVFILQ